jgi:hypothetical protein
VGCDACRTYYNDLQAMVQCEGCDVWWHQRCVGVGGSADDDDESDFTCIHCRSAEGMDDVERVLCDQSPAFDLDMAAYHISSVVQHAMAFARRWFDVLSDAAFADDGASRSSRLRTIAARARELCELLLVSAPEVRDADSAAIFSISDERFQTRRAGAMLGTASLSLLRPFLFAFADCEPLSDVAVNADKRNLVVRVSMFVGPKILSETGRSTWAAAFLSLVACDAGERDAEWIAEDSAIADCILRELFARHVVARIRDALHRVDAVNRDTRRNLSFRSGIATKPAAASNVTKRVGRASDAPSPTPSLSDAPSPDPSPQKKKADTRPSPMKSRSGRIVKVKTTPD